MTEHTNGVNDNMKPSVVNNALETRSDFQRMIRQLFERVKPHFSSGRARVQLGATGAFYPDIDAAFEAFSRPLWGIAPLVAGGGSFDDWDRYRTGLVNGCDSTHKEYWGTAGDQSQKHVEMAAIGVALALVPKQLWEPLDAEEQTRIVDWLGQINEAALPNGNWLFFRVLTNLGLRTVDADHDWKQVQNDLDQLEECYLDDGWYSDGPDGLRDYYNAWEMHVDGLIYAQLAEDEDPDRAARFRDRADQFSQEYVHWFSADGRALPYGRSLTYRFAQAAFWGALPFADTKPTSLSWGEIRGLWARNIRWWLRQPIFTDGGLLSIGYRYPNLKMAELYNAPGGPYWALKAALPLACSADHPFWKATEQPMPTLPAVTVQEEPNQLICRDERTDHQYSLTAGQSLDEHFSKDREKYNKFAYSTEFGVSVPSKKLGLLGAGHDSTLVLSEDGRHFRMREDVTDQSVSEHAAYSRWEPYDDVTVDTWLIPVLPWHVRVHRIDSARHLHSAEGGFALDRTGDHDSDCYEHRTDGESALTRYPSGSSGIRALDGNCDGQVVVQDSNTNLHAQRTVVPTLTGTIEPRISWLACASVATSESDIQLPWGDPPHVITANDGFTVETADGTVEYREKYNVKQ